MARPSDYTQDLADRICSELAAGKSLRTVCEPEDMPCKASVFNWFRTKEGFLDQYARAKEEAADALVEEIMDIADDAAGDVQRDRLRVDTRKWVASKLKPKKYGEKLETTHRGDVSAPVAFRLIPL